ncbi:hydroxyethylthiazole kinase [Salinicoccus sp. ID82-1]|uniref:hydroxyethylthiazole kinase n=1 Tax=Salinicoccus sp. ID82-1 TaxID=2820269 RepID=UPI001EFF646B|nr:hydroxyethylthiazole kinase [Salinicoccus sp. ID82-1]MCG1008925.1 hydroxyethylthiazole kinase [Salinicoccus sp. ID82-1]
MKRIEKLKIQSPLVVCITNDVVKNFTANGMLAAGASPIMSGEKAEAHDLMHAASALLINIGTADRAKVELMDRMMEAANEKGKPIVFDPVGYGASDFRIDITEDLLSRHQVSLIKGNGGEMLALSGAESSLKGVDSTEQTDTAEIADAVYSRFRVPALVTGKVDALATENGIVTMFNGHSLQGKITGSGCLLGALTAGFIGLEKEFTAEAVVDAVSYYNLCAECAAAQMSRPAPGTFISHLIDELYLSEDRLLQDRTVKGL